MPTTPENGHASDQAATRSRNASLIKRRLKTLIGLALLTVILTVTVRTIHRVAMTVLPVTSTVGMVIEKIAHLEMASLLSPLSGIDTSTLVCKAIGIGCPARGNNDALNSEDYYSQLGPLSRTRQLSSGITFLHCLNDLRAVSQEDDLVTQ